MKTISMFAFGAVILLLGGCDWAGIGGNGKITTEQRTVEPFTEVEAGGALKVEWRPGPPALSITTDQNLLSHIESRNRGNRLELHTRDSLRPTQGRIKVEISSPSLAGAKLSGAADFTGHAISDQTFAVQSSGAATIVLDGKVDELLADLTGASDLKAKDLPARTVEISATGAADASVTVSDTLRVSITGAGDVNYWGNPKTIERRITGAGSIRHKD
jgi:Putative auto-transporter adhesin, head GIN domain